MPQQSDPEMGINSWLEEELYAEYLRDRSNVDETWKRVFEKSNGGGKSAPVAATAPSVSAPARQAVPAPALDLSNSDLQPLRGAPARIAENMSASLSIPLATSQRTVAVKVMDENRRVINQHRSVLGQSKVSYTHLIGWAIVKALEDIPALNHAYAEKDGQPYRLLHPEINLGIAIDVAGKDGARSLMVPNIRNAG